MQIFFFLGWNSYQIAKVFSKHWFGLSYQNVISLQIVLLEKGI